MRSISSWTRLLITYRTMSTRSHSPPSLPTPLSPPAKRQRLQSPPSSVANVQAELPYADGLHLAPMVRIGTLPMRLLALEYGATLVWGPEIVDKAIIGAVREVDPQSGVIRYTKNNRPIFETHPIERSRLIFQLGSADPLLAVQAAKVVEQDVAGVGLNCGCPKSFSIQGGMGAALLSEPDKLCSILTALTTSLSVPIDAKIRLLPEQPPTLELVKRILKTGISALTVHCRTRDMRSSEAALLHRLREVVDLVQAEGGVVTREGVDKGRRRDVPVIANGDCFGVQDRRRIEELTGVTSIMIARGAEANPSCFRALPVSSLPVAMSTSLPSPSSGTSTPQPPTTAEGSPTPTSSSAVLLEPHLADPITSVIPLLLRLSLATGNAFGNTKYIINSMNLALTPPPPTGEKARTKDERNGFKAGMNRAKDFGAAGEVFGLGKEEVEKAKGVKVVELVPGWEARRRVIAGETAAEEERRGEKTAEKEEVKA
ncbi:hypothetical protein BCR35DRAFT_355514 [Leucosporidium creatinivorum]|uniref:DUS-like FMN-binding domain-containing protein n=1 Tax=Leucosporidium creatinivorum TaxID=106004 RepID=A0A1Y2DEL3_9BASI|nr:hypothetical protein BCR35DRAFT_355514 [Leucosporidium creatinivorum]